MTARQGVFLFVLLLTAIGTALLFAAVRLRGASGSGPAGTLLVFDLPFDLEEADTPLQPLSLEFRHRNHYRVHEIVEGLRRAAADDHVRGLVVHIDELDWGWAKAQEIRDAIQRFHDAGKPVYASVVGGSELEYLIASVADMVAMPPSATLELDGLSASALFLRGALDKLDVTPNFVQSGVYKSGVEEYTRSGMSPEAREALDAVLDSEYRLLVDSLATARGFDDRDVKRLLDSGPFTADDARTAGLVDTLLYDAEVDSLAMDDQTQDVSTTSFSRYLARLGARRGGPRIALITAAGTIMPGKSRNDPGEDLVLGSETMIDALQEARTRNAIKAVVLRIDSPGGSVEASDDIWREVKRLSDEKPVIVSMSDYAASGGYYIAAPAQRIVAQPASLTGSIGVFGGKLNVLGLFKKFGLNVETVSRGEHADMMSPYRDFTPEERKRYQRQVDASYQLFLSRVVEGRGLGWAEADSVAQGRVWSGLDAREIGLVDTLGGLETALSLAYDAGGIARRDRGSVEVLPRLEHHWYEGLLEGLFEYDDDALAGRLGLNRSVVPSRAASILLSPVVKAWITVSKLRAGIVLALMPYAIEIR